MQDHAPWIERTAAHVEVERAVDVIRPYGHLRRQVEDLQSRQVHLRDGDRFAPHVSGDESYRLVGVVCCEHTLAQGGPGPHDERSVETMGPIWRLQKVHDELGPGTSGEVRVSVDVDTAACGGGSAIAHGGGGARPAA